MTARGGATAYAGGRLRLDHPAPHVARLTLDAPATRNALDLELLEALTRLVPALEARCLLLTGAGSAFCAGYDLASLPREALAARAEALISRPFEAAMEAVAAFPFPVLAALNGAAIGGGLELALACDLRMAAADARLGIPPARLGLVYPRAGLRRFLEVAGAARTRELFLTARVVDAEEALGWGLVNAVVAPDALAERALAWAKEIAAHAPLALAGNKRVIDALLASDGGLGGEDADALDALRAASLRSADFAEGVAAFLEKRAPRWTGG